MAPTSQEEVRITELEQKVKLLEQGMRQSANLRDMWSKAVAELKATKAELKDKNAALEEEMALRERMEAELRLGQKLDALGQLAQGIAHEINTPIQFIADNTEFLKGAFGSYAALAEHVRSGDGSGEVDWAELDILAEDVLDAIIDSLEGIGHVAAIVRSLKEFSRRGGDEKAPVDVNQALETTVTVAQSQWKDVASIEWDLDARIPKIYAAAAELNQVFLNLLLNAAEAVAGGVEPGVITIATAPADNGVAVRFTDNGRGIPDSMIDEIFDPFFTTKDVVAGAGQGLSIAHAIVVDHHGGRITVESEPGKGATFQVWLPINSPE